MIALRWFLGVVLVLSGAGFVVLGVVGSGFRRSFGASEGNPFVIIGPLAAMAALLVALVWPEQRVALHLGAFAAAVLAGLCVWQIFADAAYFLWWVVAFLGAWFVFYARTLAAGGAS